MGNQTSSKASNNPGHIKLDYSNRTGAYMNYWSVAIGEYDANLIDKSLKNQLISECNARILNKKKLNYRNKELTNFDSLNNVQIQDLIEPCNLGTIDYIFNELSQEVHLSNSKPVSYGLNTWIPTVFQLNKKTQTYQIVHDIVDINRAPQNEKLYKIIEKIFNKMVPNIQRCLQSYPVQQESYHNNDWKRNTAADESFTKTLNDLKATQMLDKYGVIIKMTDYQFVHENASYGGGNFHSEGFEREYIKCAALYYFDISSNVNGGNLVFQDPTYRHFGGCNAPEIGIIDNMAVFFTNKEPYKHKVNMMALKESSEKAIKEFYDKDGKRVLGTRKILGFFVVDPDQMDTVKTTQDTMVNFEYNIGSIVRYWMRFMKSKSVIAISDDVVNMIQSFVCGDMEFMKAKCDQYRAQRYHFGKRTAEYEENVLNQRKEAMRGVCD